MRKRMLMLGALSALLLTACGTATQSETASTAATESEAVSEAVSETESETTTEAAESETTETASADIMECALDTENTYADKTFVLTVEGDNVEDEGGELTLTCGDATLDLGYTQYIPESYYIVPIDDSSCHILTQNMFDDDYRTAVLATCSADGTLSCGTAVDGGIYDSSYVTEDGVSLSCSIDVLGTWGYLQFYSYDGDELTCDSHVYDLHNVADPEIAASVTEENDYYSEDGRRILTLKQDLAAFDADTNEAVTISSGTQIFPQSVDTDQNRFYFEQDGKNYYLEYERDEDAYTFTVNGIDQYDLFEIVPYAG